MNGVNPHDNLRPWHGAPGAQHLESFLTDGQVLALLSFLQLILGGGGGRGGGNIWNSKPVSG